MSLANELEMQMLALVNAERTSRGLSPLRINGLLNDSAEQHSKWQLGVDIMSHTGANGSKPGDRMRAAGYVFEGTWSNGENIAWRSQGGSAGLADDVIALHTALMNSPSHRANLLNPNFKEIGIGIEIGFFTSGGKVYPSIIATQNFATSAADNGGPGLPVPLSGSTQADTIFGTAQGEAIDGFGGHDQLVGGGGDDTLRGAEGQDTLTGGLGDDSLSGGAGNDRLLGGAGNDILGGDDGADRLEGGADADQLSGGDGNDLLLGGIGNDRLQGGQGQDTLAGGEGDDRLEGGTEADRLNGNLGNDQLLGEAGNDSLWGQDGADTLDGGTGADVLVGGAGADTFIFRDGHGTDRVQDFVDNVDTLVIGGSLWDGEMSAETFLATYAKVSGGSVVFDFGNGDVLTVTGATSVAQLLDDITFIA